MIEIGICDFSFGYTLSDLLNLSSLVLCSWHWFKDDSDYVRFELKF